MSGLKMKYFVLNPTKDDEYGRAARRALRAYASAIEEKDPKLAKDLLNWTDTIAVKIIQGKENANWHT